MELTQALDLLKTNKANKQKEMDILDLAISVLEDKFSPELQVLENAQNAVAEKQAEIVEKDRIISEKTAIIDSIPKEISPVVEEKIAE